MHADLTMFTYFHLAPDRAQTEAILSWPLPGRRRSPTRQSRRRTGGCHCSRR